MRIVLLILAFTTTSVLASTPKEFLEKVQENYSQLKSYELELTYELYKGWNGQEVQESYRSIVRANEQGAWSEILGTIQVNNSEVNLSINARDKLIVVSDPYPEKDLTSDLKKSLKMCQDARLKEETNGNKTIQLTLKSGIDIPYARMDIEVDADYMIAEVVIYYSQNINFSGSYFEQDLKHPKLKITYGSMNKSWEDTEGLSLTEKYLSNLTELKGVGVYSEYEVVDQRSKN